MGSTKVNLPAERSLAEEGRETLETQIQLAPQLYNARASQAYGDPAYQRLQMQLLDEALFGYHPAAEEGGSTAGGAGASTPAPTLSYEDWAAQEGLDPFGGGESFVYHGRDMSEFTEGDLPNADTYQQYQNYLNTAQVAGQGAGAGYGAGGAGAPGILDIFARATPVVGGIEAEANRIKRTADVRDIEELSPRIQQALRAANPEQYALLDRLKSDAENAGPTALESALRDKALSDLSLGGQLSAEEERLAVQDARQAFADRGMLRGNSAMSAEVLNRAMARNQRERERQQFAGQVAQLERAGQGADRAFMGQVTGLWGAAQADPIMAITGRQSMSPNTAMMQQGAAGNAYGQSASYFNPFSAYASDLYNTNYNAQVNAAVANANNSAGLMGSLIGAGGQLGSAYLLCWVAREAFGEESTQWVRFRHYLLTRNHRLRDAYIRGGRALARAMRADPDLHRRVSAYLERILNREPQLEY